ncbi:MAG TPA: FHA domain-containing protein [Candidatus Saccharimonadales bacterium]|nr:FHA domain-containing protein [Candidatus Saccharimonadales bacterium]
MKATCPSCGNPFLFGDERFGDRASVRVRCPSCRGVVTLENPDGPVLEADPVPAKAAPPAPPTAVREPDGDHPTVRIKKKEIVEGIEEVVPPMPANRRVSVALLSGPDTGKVIPCSTSRAVIGREGTDIPIRDEEISRKHALIEVRDDRYYLKDLGSTNGTFVDERRITETELLDKSEFRVGTTHCMLIVTPTDEI